MYWNCIKKANPRQNQGQPIVTQLECGGRWKLLGLLVKFLKRQKNHTIFPLWNMMMQWESSSVEETMDRTSSSPSKQAKVAKEWLVQGCPILVFESFFFFFDFTGDWQTAFSVRYRHLLNWCVNQSWNLQFYCKVLLIMRFDFKQRGERWYCMCWRHGKKLIQMWFLPNGITFRNIDKVLWAFVMETKIF